jgi:hypothetical protein
MVPGAIRLVDCSVVPCDVDVPSRTFTTITAEVIATTTFASGNLEYLYFTAQYNGYGCTGGDSRWYATTIYDPYNFIDVKSWTTSSVSDTKLIWTYDPGSANTQLPTGIATGGIYYRGASTTILASSIPYKQNQYAFTRSFGGGNYVQHTTSTTAGAGTDTSWSCCAPEIPGPNVEIISPGATVSKTIGALTNGNMYIRYVAVSSQVTYGMTLQLTAGGLVNAPWTVKVDGGSIIFIDVNGVTTSYSGTLTAVRTAINAAGNFTSVIGANINTTGGVTNATTSDLLPFLSHDLKITTCTTGLPLVKAGSELAPSSTGCGIYNEISTPRFLFTTSLGFPDTKAGFDLFLNSSWFTKNSSFQDGAINTFWYYISNEFDFWAMYPDSGLFVLTGGPSVQTKVITVTESSNQSDIYTGTTTCGNGDPFFACGPLQLQCNWPFPDSCFNACDGTPLSSCSTTIPFEGCCPCTNLVTTVEPGSSRDLTATQILTGSFRVQ